MVRSPKLLELLTDTEASRQISAVLFHGLPHPQPKPSVCRFTIEQMGGAGIRS
jgi:hypothetical protein